MKQTLLGLILCSCLMAATQAEASVQSYREWKAQRIQTATSQISLLKAQLASAQMIGRKGQVSNLDKEIAQQQWNLDVAKDLSVTDYFVLYLSQVSDANRFKQAAAKMSLNEIEEMMRAYSEAVGANQPASEAASNKLLPVQAGEIHEQMK